MNIQRMSKELMPKQRQQSTATTHTSSSSCSEEQIKKSVQVVSGARPVEKVIKRR